MSIEQELSTHTALHTLREWMLSDRRRSAIAFAQACELCSSPSAYAAARWVEHRDRAMMAQVNGAYLLMEARKLSSKEGSADAAMEAVLEKIENGELELPFPFLDDTSPSAEFL